MSDPAASATDPKPTAPEVILAVILDRIAALRQRLVESHDADRPLNELGIDSLGAMTLVGELEERFRVALDAVEVFECPTPRALARLVSARSGYHVDP